MPSIVFSASMSFSTQFTFSYIVAIRITISNEMGTLEQMDIVVFVQISYMSM